MKQNAIGAVCWTRRDAEYAVAAEPDAAFWIQHPQPQPAALHRIICRQFPSLCRNLYCHQVPTPFERSSSAHPPISPHPKAQVPLRQDWEYEGVPMDVDGTDLVAT